MRKRKRAPKKPLPDGVIALMTPEAQEKYLATRALEVEGASSSPAAPMSPDPTLSPSQPASSGTQSDPEASDDDDEDDDDFDNVVFFNAVADDDDDDDDNDYVGPPRKKAAKISIIEPDVEMEEN